MLRRPSLLISAFILILTASYAQAAEVRVLVAEKQPRLLVSVKNEYRISSLPALAIVKKGKGITNLAIQATPKGIKIGAEEFPVRGIRIESGDSRDLMLGQMRFRGVLDITKDAQGALAAVNRLDLEQYLYGVLPYEVAFWWPMEGLKAQAVAARTYALYQVSVSRAQEFDVKNTTSSQVYGGTMKERYRTNVAVDKTRGQSLEYQGKVFPAYFHATCGGMTAAASELWKIDLPPLAGKVPCTYCRISPHWKWSSKVPLADIEEKLAQNGRPIGRVLSLEPVTRTPSNRVGSLKITGANGEAVIAAKDFRVWLGGDKIRSTDFTVAVKDDTVEFQGKGWGHGVGLCQWGTLGQAILGKKYDEILKFYYPGASIGSSEKPKAT
jgi:stage II sporulation protein D